MKAAIIHGTMNLWGGGEFLSIMVARILGEMGFETHYFTYDKTDWSTISKLHGFHFKPDEEYYLIGKPISKANLNVPDYYLYGLKLNRIIDRKNYKLIVNTFGGKIPVMSDLRFLQAIPVTFWFKKKIGDPRLSLKTKLYYAIVYGLYKPLNSTFKRPLLVFNSRYIYGMIASKMNLRGCVIYPPVNIEPYLNVSGDENYRDDIAVTIGRFSPVKKYELLVEMARHLPQLDFYIIGILSGEKGYNYYRKIKEISQGLDNVKLLTNLNIKERIKLLSRSKIYVHAASNEAFGISIVEAMAAGVVPIVYMSGGPWLDILGGRNGVYGYAYKSLSEVVTLIKGLIKNESKLKEMSKRAVNRSKFFGLDKFSERIKVIVNKILKSF